MRQLSPIQLQQQIIHYKSEMNKYKNKCESLEDKYLTQRYITLEKENDHLRSQMETYLQQLKSKDLEKNQESSKYQALFTAQEREVKKLRSLLNQVKDQLRKHILHYVKDSSTQTEKDLKKTESLENQINTLQDENSYLLKEKDLLLKTNQALHLQLYKKEIELWELEEIVKDLNEGVASQYQHLLMERSFDEEENNRLMNDNECLRDRLYLSEVEIYESHKLLTESKLYYEYVIKLQKEQLEHALQIQKCNEASIQQLQVEVQKLQDDKNLYTHSLQTVRMSIKEMKDEVFAFDDKDSGTMKDTLKNYENTIHHLQFTNALLNEEINKLKNKPDP
jgi:hypothetical protein